jgi:hypothetical protein
MVHSPSSDYGEQAVATAGGAASRGVLEVGRLGSVQRCTEALVTLGAGCKRERPSDRHCAWVCSSDSKL